MAVGDDGLLWYTADSGDTWAQLYALDLPEGTDWLGVAHLQGSDYAICSRSGILGKVTVP